MFNPIMIKIMELDGGQAPEYMTSNAAGCDVKSVDSLFLQPGETRVVRTGIALEIPTGYECQVRSRSGLAARHSVAVLNSPGTIDADYRGEVKVILHNHGHETFEIKSGDRIAQLVFAQVERVLFTAVDSLGETDRGVGGLGSTGK
jgi:dUTP pyrophosphatase